MTFIRIKDLLINIKDIIYIRKNSKDIEIYLQNHLLTTTVNTEQECDVLYDYVVKTINHI